MYMCVNASLCLALLCEFADIQPGRAALSHVGLHGLSHLVIQLILAKRVVVGALWRDLATSLDVLLEFTAGGKNEAHEGRGWLEGAC